MVTRVRIEAEARGLQELDAILQAASEALVVESLGDKTLELMYGKPDPHTGAHQGLVEARAGEYVIERGTTDEGGIRYIGRIVHHFAMPEARGKLVEAGIGKQPFHEDSETVQ